MSHVWFSDYSKGKTAVDGIQLLLDESGFTDMVPRGGTCHLFEAR